MKKPSSSFVVAALTAILAFLISYFSLFKSFDYMLYDRLLRLQANTVNEDVVIVAMDERSLQYYGPLPWKREVHAKLINQLTRAGVQAIGYDVLFNKVSTSGDAKLVEAVAENGKVVFPVVIEQVSENAELIELTPFPKLYQVANNLGLVHFELSQDNISRAVYLKAGLGEAFWRAFSAEVLEVANGDLQYQLPGKPDESAPASMDLTRIEKEQLYYVPFKNNPTYFKRVSFVDLAENSHYLSELKGKVVFVGVTAAAARNADFLPVPMDRKGQIMPGVEINATLYDGLKNNSVISKVDNWLVALLSSGLIFIIFYYLPQSLPRRSFYYLLFIMLCIATFCWWQLHYNHRWWPMVTPLVIILLGYLIWSWKKVVNNMTFFNNTIERLKIETQHSIDVGQAPDLKTQLAFLSKLDLVDQEKTEKFIGEQDPEQPFLGGSKYLQVKKDNLTTQDENLYRKVIASRNEIKKIESNISIGIIEKRVTEVEGAIAQINLLRRFIEQTMERMSDGIVMIDTSGRIFYSNILAKSFLPTLRLEKDIFKVLAELKLSSNKSWTEHIKQLLSDSVGQEILVITKMGLDLKISISLLNNVSGRDYIILNLTDITAIKREQRRQLEMIDFISHDLRSPLTSILAILTRYKQNPEQFEHANMNQEIERLTRSSLTLAEHFLMLSRAESHVEIALYPIELLNTIDNAMAIVSPQAKENNIQIEFDFSLYDDIWLMANQDLLERVITNLLSNAVKYSIKGGKVKIEIKTIEQKLQVQIIDQGEGIDPIQMESIFKPFTRMQKHEMANVKGIGLGLRFVRSAMLRLGGSVEVASEIGQGSCFTLMFPQATILDDEE